MLPSFVVKSPKAIGFWYQIAFRPQDLTHVFFFKRDVSIFMTAFHLKQTRVSFFITAVLSETTRVLQSITAVLSEMIRVIESMTAVRLWSGGV